jgi:hypothetical protein
MHDKLYIQFKTNTVEMLALVPANSLFNFHRDDDKYK